MKYLSILLTFFTLLIVGCNTVQNEDADSQKVATITYYIEENLKLETGDSISFEFTTNDSYYQTLKVEAMTGNHLTYRILNINGDTVKTIQANQPYVVVVKDFANGADLADVSLGIGSVDFHPEVFKNWYVNFKKEWRFVLDSIGEIDEKIMSFNYTIDNTPQLMSFTKDSVHTYYFEHDSLKSKIIKSSYSITHRADSWTYLKIKDNNLIFDCIWGQEHEDYLDLNLLPYSGNVPPTEWENKSGKFDKSLSVTIPHDDTISNTIIGNEYGLHDIKCDSGYSYLIKLNDVTLEWPVLAIGDSNLNVIRNYHGPITEFSFDCEKTGIYYVSVLSSYDPGSYSITYKKND